MASSYGYRYAFKIVISGPFNAGKTTFVRTLSEISLGTERPVTRQEERAVKEKTTVGLDFGLVDLGDGYVVRLFGTPGQRRFSFMWRILSRGMHGYMLLLDSTDESSIIECGKIYSEFKEFAGGIPHIIGANKQDIPGAFSPEDIKLALDIPDEVIVVPMVARDHSSAWNALKTLLQLCMVHEAQSLSQLNTR